MPSDLPGNEPNLELPSFGFRRKKKRDKETETPAADPVAEAAPGAPGAPAAPETTASAVPEAPEAERPVLPPAAPRAPSAPATPPGTTGAAPAPARPAARPPARPAARPPSRPPTAAPPPAPPRQSTATPAAQPAAPPATPHVAPPDTPAVTPAAPQSGTEAATQLDDTLVDPLGTAAAALDLPRTSTPSRRASRAQSRAERWAEKIAAKRARRLAGQQTDVPESEAAEHVTVSSADAVIEPEDESRLAPAERLVARLPAINPLVAAVLTGLLCGLATVLLAFGTARGCESVRGTESCGGGAGLLALVAILAIEVLIGASLLKAWQIADPFSTSFLGVGVVATIAMLGFLSHINSPWMLLVIPLMTGASFALSWWVTVRFIDEYDDQRPTPTEDRSDRDDAHA